MGVFAGGVCAKAADQREDTGKVGAGTGQAESAGGGACSAGTLVSRHAGAAGEVGSGMIGSESGSDGEKGRVKTRTLRTEACGTHTLPAKYESATRPRCCLQNRVKVNSGHEAQYSQRLLLL